MSTTNEAPSLVELMGAYIRECPDSSVSDRGDFSGGPRNSVTLPVPRELRQWCRQATVHPPAFYRIGHHPCV